MRCTCGLRERSPREKPEDFNAEFAVDEAMLWQFLESTQALRQGNRLLYFALRHADP